MDIANTAIDSMSDREDMAPSEDFSAVETVRKHVSAATNAFTEKVNAMADAALENVSELQIKSAEEREQRRAEAQARREQLEKTRAEWIQKFNERRHRLLRYLFSSHPDMQHNRYQEAMDELRAIMEGKDGKETKDGMEGKDEIKK